MAWISDTPQRVVPDGPTWPDPGSIQLSTKTETAERKLRRFCLRKRIRRCYQEPIENKMPWRKHLPTQLIDLYEVYNYRHAAEVLATAYPDALAEIGAALGAFRLTKSDISAAGGNESGITKRFRELLRPNGWEETKVTADLLVRRAVGRKADEEDDEASPDLLRKGYIEGHKIDFVKGSVALDFEWNSKDQTFDRDLYALRTFYECGVIAAGVLVTRSEQMNAIFRDLGVLQKYGASTTWMGKLLPRLEAGRNGGCPVLVSLTGVSQHDDLGSHA